MTKTEYFEVIGYRDDKEVLYGKAQDVEKARAMGSTGLESKSLNYTSVAIFKVIELRELTGMLNK